MTRSTSSIRFLRAHLVCRAVSAAVALGLGDLLFSASAAVPTLDHLYPVAAQPGTSNVVTAIGKFDPWPVQAWVDDPAVRFESETNKGIFRVTVGTNAAPGPHLVRLFNSDGSSRPRFFIVDRDRQTAEKESNDDYSEPQVIEAMPVVVNGRLDKTGDVDSFAVELTAGQTLIAFLEAYVLGSPVDALLRITDDRGVQLGWNHDDGRTLDPRLVFTARRPGRYVVQVMGFPHPATAAIRFHGGNDCVYRLHLSSGPYVSHTLPLGVQRNARTVLHPGGWNGEGRMPSESAFDSRTLSPEASTALVEVPGAENTLCVPVGDGPERVEAEPNDAVAKANSLAEIPGAVTGCVASAGDEDRFTFVGKKGEKLRLEVSAAALGFPWDPWVAIEDESGKQLARNDDSGGPDPALDWTVPADGKYLASVGNLLHDGGTNHLYRLSIRHSLPDFAVTAADHSILVKPGTTNNFKINVSRLHDFTNELTATAHDLPTGVSASTETVPAKGGEVKLSLTVATNAPASNGPFFVEVTGGGRTRRAGFEMVSRTVDNGVPGGFQKLVLESTDQFWMTIPPPATPDTNKTAGATAPAGK